MITNCINALERGIAFENLYSIIYECIDVFVCSLVG